VPKGSEGELSPNSRDLHCRLAKYDPLYAIAVAVIEALMHSNFDDAMCATSSQK
jgi:hypothetical protein